ncbi:MAG: redoxin domain-containing protein [Gemmatimonadales bacterium]|jgi:tetratricopeptide (TPR) repeat protein
MSSSRFVLSLAVAILLAVPVRAARAQSAGRTLAERLSWFNYAMDYAGGVAEARARPRELRDPRAAAWYVLLLARDQETPASLALADSMMAADPGSVWAWFARTAALGYHSYADSSAAALAASDSMCGRAPRDPDVVWLRVATLSNARGMKDVIPIVDSALARDPSATRLLVLRANATWSAASQTHPPNEAMRDTAESLWAKARSIDSTDIRAWEFAGSYLLDVGRLEDAQALLRRASELAPLSLGVNRDYWRALRSLHMRDREQAASAALPGIERVRAARGNDPAALQLLANEYEAFGMPDSQRVTEDRILRDHPASIAAEWVLVSRYRAVGTKVADTTVHDSTLKGTYRGMLAAFIARPTHLNERLLGDAYRELFHQADSTTHPDTLLQIILGMERYEGINPQITFAQGAIALADRGVHLDEAERLARQGVIAGRQRIEQERSFLDPDQYTQARDWMASTMADALGWVYIRAGRLQDAEQQLRQALDLAPKNLTTLNHLGRLLEAAGTLDSAEAYYIRGAMVPTPGKNPNREALQKLYVTRHGSAQGYDAYYATIRDRDRARRRAEVTAELKTVRDTLPAFTLVSLAGDTVRSSALAGHVTVINFWGMWCGPCVMEMPEVQRYWRQVAQDSTVRLLTINNDPDLTALREWMQRHQYDLPVLVDAGYAGRAGVQAYPTTWFVDRAGRIAFSKAGWSEELAEEFGWRVEILKAELR